MGAASRWKCTWKGYALPDTFACDALIRLARKIDDYDMRGLLNRKMIHAFLRAGRLQARCLTTTVLCS